MIMSKSDNSQEAFGNGVISTYVDDRNQNYGMLMNSGTLSNKGQFFGYNDDYHQVKVFHIEGWWGDRDNYIHGLMCVSSSSVKVSLTGPYNYTGSGYNAVSGMTSSVNGYATTTSTNEYGRFATAVNGSESTYTCDYQRYYNNSDTRFASVGGDCGNGSVCGASYVCVDYTSSHSYWSFGASLSFV